MDLADPFREGIPDFGDPDLNKLAATISRGVENGRALAGMTSVDSIARAIGALTEEEAKVTLLAMAIWIAKPSVQ